MCIINNVQVLLNMTVQEGCKDLAWALSSVARCRGKNTRGGAREGEEKKGEGGREGRGRGKATTSTLVLTQDQVRMPHKAPQSGQKSKRGGGGDAPGLLVGAPHDA